MTVGGLALVRVAPGDELSDGTDQSSHVETQVPVLDVPVVEVHTLVEGCIASQPMRLGPTCHAWSDPVTVLIPSELLIELVDENWTLRTRPHETHVPYKHIEELRQFVQARPS